MSLAQRRGMVARGELRARGYCRLRRVEVNVPVRESPAADVGPSSRPVDQGPENAPSRIEGAGETPDVREGPDEIRVGDHRAPRRDARPGFSVATRIFDQESGLEALESS